MEAVEIISRKCMTRECVWNAAAAVALVGSGGVVALLWISTTMWFFGKYFWMW